MTANLNILDIHSIDIEVNADLEYIRSRHFKLADMKKLLKGIDEWARRRILK